MLRLFPTRRFQELKKFKRFVAPCLTKREVPRFRPVSSTSRPPTDFVRLYNTGNPMWKDALQPKKDQSEETETIDLDKWKSVMRSQVTSEEKLHINDEEEVSVYNESNEEQVGNLKDGCLLDATRNLVEMWRQAGRLVPHEMTDEEVQALAELHTKSSKKKYLKHLAIKERHKRVNKEKQQQRKLEKKALEQNKGQDISAEEGDDQKQQDLKNTFLLQYWTKSLDKLLAWRSAQAMMFNQPLVFDLTYESNMSRRELENAVSQLMEVEGWNRRANEPFHLHFCNLQPDGAYKKELLKRYGAEAWSRLFITCSDRQHVDMFPREQLVYLTADSPNVLRTFDHSKIYIIGALVDRSIQSGLSLANAKRLKLATARLPLDEFLHWEMGAKNLTLDQMVRIMLTIKETGKWEEALKFVPHRKHDGFHYQQKQNEIPNNQGRGVTKYGSREDGDRQLRSGERTSKNGGRTLYRPQNQYVFTSGDRMAEVPGGRGKLATSREHMSLKNSMKGKRGPGKAKMWWEDE